MVDIQDFHYKEPMVFSRAVLEYGDIFTNIVAISRAEVARKWIRKQGYHLRESSGFAGIRLEKYKHTIIEVQVGDGVFNDSFPFTENCICYAAMLLYRRLKRDGVIV